MYVGNRLRYRRFATREVRVGDLGIGGNNPLRVQSMTNCDTADVQACLRQVRALHDAGAELVRLAVRRDSDIAALAELRTLLKQDRIATPLCADVHFSPRLAQAVIPHVEKVRINPGNFADRRELKDSDPDAAHAQARELFLPFVEELKREGRALRIGVNHGSLSARMVQLHGDTTQGMIESAAEYIAFCEEAGFRDVILSMKSSNVRVMIYAVRGIVSRMRDEGVHYPLHLGVTEAGGGIDGILKGAQGIGALLEDGIGDTIRLSLSDAPEMEISPALQLARNYQQPPAAQNRLAYPECGQEYERWEPRITHLTGDRRGRLRVGSDAVFPVCLKAGAQDVPGISPLLVQLPGPDSVLPDDPGESGMVCRDPEIRRVSLYRSDLVDAKVVRRVIPVEVIHDDVSSWEGLAGEVDEILQFHITTRDVAQINSMVKYIHEHFPAGRTMVSIGGGNPVHRYRLLDLVLRKVGSRMPVDYFVSPEECRDPLTLAARLGCLLSDGLIHSLTISGDVAMTGSRFFAFSLLQGAGARRFATEFVACPTCARLSYDHGALLAEAQEKLAHLKGLKIGVMGCVVNGPGEMADADYGFVGSGPELVDLYIGQDVHRHKVPVAEAVDALISLIRSRDQWKDAGEL